MSAIIFDEELRQFSVVDDEGYVISDETFSGHAGGAVKLGYAAGRVGKHIMNNKRAYMDVGGTAVGALGARAIAKKMALKRGLEPGTPEYKAFVNKMTAGGAAAGLTLSEAGQFGYRTGSNLRMMRRGAAKRAIIEAKSQGLTGAEKKLYIRKKTNEYKKDATVMNALKGTGKQVYVDPAKKGYASTKSAAKQLGSAISHPMVTARGMRKAAEIGYNK